MLAPHYLGQVSRAAIKNILNATTGRYGKKSSRQMAAVLVSQAAESRIEPLEPRRMLSQSPLIYNVPNDGYFHNLTLEIDGTNSAQLDIYDQAVLVAFAPLASTNAVQIISAAGQQSDLSVDFVNGFIPLPVYFDGGAGFAGSELWVGDSGGPSDGLTAQATYQPGPVVGAGYLSANAWQSGLPLGTFSINFVNLQTIPLYPALEYIVSGTLQVDGTSGNDSIVYDNSPGTTAWGQVTVDNLTPIDFIQQTNLTIDNGTGTDNVDIDDPYTPQDLTQITVNGGGSSEIDTLTETGVPGAISGFIPNQFVVDPSGAGAGTLYDYQSGSPANSMPINMLLPVTYTGIGAIKLVGQLTTDQVQETNPGSHAEYTWTPGANPGSATITGDVTTGFTFAPITYTGCDGGTFLGSGDGSGINGGSTNITIDGASGNDTFWYSDSTVNTAYLSDAHGTYENLSWDPTSATETVTLDGGAGVNTFSFDMVAGTTPTNFTLNTQSLTPDIIDYHATANAYVDPNDRYVTSLDAPGLYFSNETTFNIDAGGGGLEVDGTYGSASSIAYTPQTNSSGLITSGAFTLQATNVDGTFVVDPNAGLANGTMIVNGSATGGAIVVSDGAKLGGDTQVAVNALLPVQVVDADAAILDIEGGPGNDFLTVDSSGGGETIPVTFNGGGGINSLELGGGAASEDVYTPGPTPGAGSDLLVFGPVIETVSFTGLAPVYDDVAGPLTVDGPDGSNTISYVSGSSATHGKVVVDNFESIDFTNKSGLNLVAGAGDNQINIINGNTPTGLTSITVEGGAGWNSLTVNALGSGVNVSTPGQVAVTGQPVVNYSSIQQVTVTNALDVVNGFGGFPSGTEGQLLSNANVGSFAGGPLGAQLSDFTASIAWGDGATSAGVVAAGLNVTGSHTYAEEGDYDPTVTVTDPNTSGSAVIGGVPVTVDYTGPMNLVISSSIVHIVDPSVIAAAITSPTVTAATGSSTGSVKLATFTDPGGAEALADYGASINWGDGMTTSGTITVAGGAFTVAGAHTYSLAGTYTPTITISHDSSIAQTVTDTNRIVVTNAGGISSSASNLSGQEGRVASGAIAHFSVANTSAPSSAFWASINWGDGQSSSGTIVSDGSGHFHVTASHVYAEELAYLFTVTIHEVGGFSAAASATANIAPSPLDQLAGVSVVRALDQNNMTNLVLGTFRDQDATETDPTTYTGTINWGDGHSSSATFVYVSSKYNTGSYWKIEGSHNYSSTAKKYTVTITFHDRGGPFSNSVITSTIKIG